ncbi:MAG: MFS transporter [Planctomycetales bacterium]|nr:MFS transporter [Planctomycetales bacterium]
MTGSNDGGSSEGSSTGGRLFWASFLTLIAAGIGFSVRSAILVDWSAHFGFTQGELGGITGGGLVGFGLTIIFFSFFADIVGYGRLMTIAFLLHVASVVVTLAAAPIYASFGKDATYQCLYWGALLFSLANGTCEAVINPLTATLYPKNKTHWLNILHAGWPGGLILGALLGLVFKSMKVSWEIQIASYLLPTLAYGGLMLGQRFPHSEAKAAGVPLATMLKEVGLLGAGVIVALLGLWLHDLLPGLGIPGLVGPVIAIVLLVVFGMFTQFAIGHWMLAMLLVIHGLVGYVELGTDSWIANITGTILENPQYGLLLFIWTSGLMFALRFFAGPIVHHISPLGLLLASAILGAIGLTLLGRSNGAIMVVLAATIYGFGKTFLWPTMLGVVSERFPKGGAMTLGAVGGIGMLSAGILGGPGIGYKQDYFASSTLKESSTEAYSRYQASSERAFLFFPAVKGLDGAKVANLLPDAGDPGDPLQKDIAALEKSGRKLEDVKELAALKEWWDKEGAPNAEKDKAPVKAARLAGGKMALQWTALVPALMAIGYLILVVYFRSQGGYTAQVLSGHKAEDEKFTGGVEGPVE